MILESNLIELSKVSVILTFSSWYVFYGMNLNHNYYCNYFFTTCNPVVYGFIKSNLMIYPNTLFSMFSEAKELNYISVT